MAFRSPRIILEDIASDIMLAEAADKASLIGLLDLFQEFTRSLSPSVPQAIQDQALQCTELLTGLLMDMEEKPNEVLEKLGTSISSLQHGMADIPDEHLTRSEDEVDVQEEVSSPYPPEATPGVFQLPEWVDDISFREFLTNQKLVLEELEGDILALENDEENSLAVFKRKIHTMKGEAGVLGLEDLGEVCHGVEDFVEDCEDKAILVDRLLYVRDWIKASLERYAMMKTPCPSGEELLEQVRDLSTPLKEHDLQAPCESRSDEVQMVEECQPAPLPVETLPPEPVVEVTKLDRDEETVLMIGEFLQESDEGLHNADQILMDMEEEGTNEELINSLFRVFHTVKGVAGFLELREIEKLAHTTETMLNQARQGTLELQGVAMDLVFDSTAMMRKMLTLIRQAIEEGTTVPSVPERILHLQKLEAVINGESIPDAEPLPQASEKDRLGDVLSKPPIKIEKAALDNAVESQKESGRRLGEELVEQGQVSPKQVGQALRAKKQATSAAKLKETVKVDLERVDSLVEMIGELVIVESMVVHSPEITELHSPRVRNFLGQLTKITRDLQSVGMQMRMVPVRGVFQKMARMVRDLSRKGGKDIQFIQNGEGTEMDRSMVEQIGDPLVHMIRNSVDHGIESAEDRVAKGKPAQGTIQLSAYHEGGSIVIEIKDDGKGLDKEVILAKAKKQQLITEEDALSDSEIFSLIFAPGFSTAKQVTEISGRGVGMDVVKRNIEAMRGRVMTSSEKDKGTVFKMVLPLTLAIIDGMLVECGQEQYIIPTLTIVESIKPEAKMLSSFAGHGEIINVRGEILPLLRLDQLLDVKDAKQDPTEALVVIIETFGRRMGLLVDEVLTQQQVVIKSVGAGIGRMKYVSGSAILSDGRVGLILNVEEFGALVENRKRRAGGEESSGVMQEQTSTIQ